VEFYKEETPAIPPAKGELRIHQEIFNVIAVFRKAIVFFAALGVLCAWEGNFPNYLQGTEKAEKRKLDAILLY